MKTKKSAQLTDYHVYNLSNPHFVNAEIVTDEGKKIKGQFVRFKVTEQNRGYKVYPSEKFCFLPQKNKKEFWDQHKKGKGIFKAFPEYIKELGFNQIEKIVIKPVLILE